MKVRDSAGTLRTVKSLRVRDAANTLRNVSALRVRDSANTLRNVANIGGMTVTPSPDSVFGYGNSHGSITVTTGITSVTVDGGTAPYIYAWTTGGTCSAVTPTIASTIFRFLGMGPGDHQEDTATCTVTDAHGNVGVSNTVSISADNYGT